MRLSTYALTFLLAATPMLLTGCAGGGGTDSQPPAASVPPVVELAEPVQILAKLHGTQKQIDSYGLGILDAEAVAGLGLFEDFAEIGVSVDLAVHSVVLFSLGEQNTGGFSADINGLQIKGDELYVQGTAIAPGSDAVVTQALTYPYCVVAVPKLPAGLTLLSDITSLP
ncbi:MAG: protease complex subunit PrcB family protein [Planctomycetota bacterium]